MSEGGFKTRPYNSDFFCALCAAQVPSQEFILSVAEGLRTSFAVKSSGSETLVAALPRYSFVVCPMRTIDQTVRTAHPTRLNGRQPIGNGSVSGRFRSRGLFLFQVQHAFLRVDVHAEVAQEIQT